MFKEYLINNLDIDLENINSDTEIAENCGNILKNVGLGKETDVCFNYALKNKKLDYVEEGVEFLRKNYRNIDFENVRTGDIIIFKDDYDYLHFARVRYKNKNINDLIIRAKFGGLGIYEHRLGDTPGFYGHRVEFWRKNKIIKKLFSKKVVSCCGTKK